MNKEITNMSTLDIVCSTEYEEFFYKDSNEVVPDGEPIGIDVDSGEEIYLVLFSNICWSPPLQ